MIEIADDMSRDFKTVIKNGRPRNALLILTWPLHGPNCALKLGSDISRQEVHSKWGDVSTLITKSDDPMDCANLSTEELEKRLADLDVKDRFKAA